LASVTSYGVSGVGTSPSNGVSSVSGIALITNGSGGSVTSAAVFGTTRGSGSAGASVISRFSAAGSPDATWGTGGSYVSDFGTDDVVSFGADGGAVETSVISGALRAVKLRATNGVSVTQRAAQIVGPFTGSVGSTLSYSLSSDPELPWCGPPPSTAPWSPQDGGDVRLYPAGEGTSVVTATWPGATSDVSATQLSQGVAVGPEGVRNLTITGDAFTGTNHGAVFVAKSDPIKTKNERVAYQWSITKGGSPVDLSGLRTDMASFAFRPSTVGTYLVSVLAHVVKRGEDSQGEPVDRDVPGAASATANSSVVVIDAAGDEPITKVESSAAGADSGLAMVVQSDARSSLAAAASSRGGTRKGPCSR